MICPKCGKEEHDDSRKSCYYCGAKFDAETVVPVAQPAPVPAESTEQPAQPKAPEPVRNKNAFKQFFWISFWITIVGLFFGVGLIASPIIWIIFLCVNKEKGAHGWIAGWGTALGILLLVFGGCLLALTGAFH